jgi:hypothetical protein
MASQHFLDFPPDVLTSAGVKVVLGTAEEFAEPMSKKLALDMVTLQSGRKANPLTLLKPRETAMVQVKQSAPTRRAATSASCRRRWSPTTAGSSSSRTTRSSRRCSPATEREAGRVVFGDGQPLLIDPVWVFFTRLHGDDGSNAMQLAMQLVPDAGEPRFQAAYTADPELGAPPRGPQSR